MKGQSAISKRKQSSAKVTWQTIRRRYTWHLRPLFKNTFDRTHWWEGQSGVEPIAALYELARRHPLVREYWLGEATAIRKHQRGNPICGGRRFSKVILAEGWLQAREPTHPPPSLYWTCLLGLKSWAKLDYTERRNWEFSVGHLKGLDFRWEELQCRSINELAYWKIRYQREDALGDKVKGKRRGGEIGKIINADLAAKPPTVEEWEAAIAEQTIEEHRKGYVLLAVAPDLTVDKVESVIARKYREYPLALREEVPPLGESVWDACSSGQFWRYWS